MYQILLDILRSYVHGATSLRMLEEQVVGYMQAILDEGDEQTMRLLNIIDLSVIEIGEGLLTEEEFKERVKVYL